MIWYILVIKGWNGVSSLADNNDGLMVTCGDTSVLPIQLGRSAPSIECLASYVHRLLLGQRQSPMDTFSVLLYLCEPSICLPVACMKHSQPFPMGALTSLAVAAGMVTQVTRWVNFLRESGWVKAWHRHHEVVYTFSWASKCLRTVCMSCRERAPCCTAGVSHCTGK